MNSMQTNTLSDWKAIRDVLSRYKDSWQDAPAFAARAASFESCWEAAHRHAGIQKQDIHGTVLSKGAARSRAVELALQAAYNVQAWAEDHNDLVTFAAMGFSHSQLDAEPEAALVSTLALITGKVADHRPELAPYGTDDAAFATLQAAVDAFSSLVAQPRSMTAMRKTATGGISATLREGRLILRRMDKLIGNFSAAHPEFVATWRNLRPLSGTGVRHRKGKDKDQE